MVPSYQRLRAADTAVGQAHLGLQIYLKCTAAEGGRHIADQFTLKLLLLHLFFAIKRTFLPVPVFPGKVGAFFHPGEIAAAIVDQIHAGTQLEPVASVIQSGKGFGVAFEARQPAGDCIPVLRLKQNIKKYLRNCAPQFRPAAAGP